MTAVLLQLSMPALLIAGASAAQRRWGPRVGGILTGLPITSLPLILLIALAHGDRFAARAAGAGLEGTVAQAVEFVNRTAGFVDLRWFEEHIAEIVQPTHLFFRM
jgi:hypothetical protein